MPTYDYECGVCGHTCEVFQSITDARKRKCPECGKNGLKRLIGAGAGLIFKGAGFYETDYRSEAYKAKAKADTESSSTSEKSSGASSGGSDGGSDVKKTAEKPAGKKADKKD